MSGLHVTVTDADGKSHAEVDHFPDGEDRNMVYLEVVDGSSENSPRQHAVAIFTPAQALRVAVALLGAAEAASDQAR